jgi:toxin ParE1/3/4
MNPTYYLRQQANEDLEKIWSYTFNNWGINQADKYVRSLLSRCAWLARQPKIGKCRNDIKPGYYSFKEGHHLVFYTIRSNGIDIIRHSTSKHGHCRPF